MGMILKEVERSLRKFHPIVSHFNLLRSRQFIAALPQGKTTLENEIRDT
jgi:hypothetical protein